MKKIFMLLSIVLVGNILINSCIYDKVCEGEASIITPPDTTIVNPPPVVSNKTFRVSLFSNFENVVNTYATIDMESPKPVLIWSSNRDDLHAGVFLKGVSTFQNKELSFASYGNSEASNTMSYETSALTSEAYGYYPYQSNASNGILSYTLSDVQDQTVSPLMDPILNKNMLMISDLSSSFSLDGGTAALPLKSVFSILRFKVNMSMYINDEYFKSIKFYIANKDNIDEPRDYKLAGNYTIDVSKAPGVSGYVGPSFSNYKNIITGTLAGQYRVTENPYIWLIVNPININADDSLVAVIGLENYTIVYRHKLNELKANTVYNFNVVPTQSNVVSNTVSALSKPSNCYIISRSGMWRIPSKKISGTPLSGETVEWLWASKEGGSSSFDISELIDPSTIQYDESGYVYFRVGSSLGKFTKGNVILALRDASGDIVWTWHIWITDKPEDKAYDNGSVFMDRNLGALSVDINNSPAVDTYGFVYQWGRKDPFFGGDGVIYDEATSILETARMHTIVNTSYTWNNYVEKVTGGNLDYSIKNPMSFIYNEGSGSSWKNDPADWLLTSNSSLWSATSKTDYDPCPDGYRVPNKGEFNILYVANVTTPKAFNQYSEKYWIYNSSSVSYWPAAGMRQGRKNSSSGIYGTQLKYSATDMLEGQCYYWTSTPFSVGGTPLLGASYRIHTVSDKLYSEDEYGDNADAYPIRCVKE